MHFIFGYKQHLIGHAKRDDAEIARWAALFADLKENKHFIILTSQGPINAKEILRFPDNTFDIILPDTSRVDPKFYDALARSLDCSKSEIASIDSGEHSRVAAQTAGVKVYPSNSAVQVRKDLRNDKLLP